MLCTHTKTYVSCWILDFTLNDVQSTLRLALFPGCVGGEKAAWYQLLPYSPSFSELRCNHSQSKLFYHPFQHSSLTGDYVEKVIDYWTPRCARCTLPEEGSGLLSIVCMRSNRLTASSIGRLTITTLPLKLSRFGDKR